VQKGKSTVHYMSKEPGIPVEQGWATPAGDLFGFELALFGFDLALFGFVLALFLLALFIVICS